MHRPTFFTTLEIYKSFDGGYQQSLTNSTSHGPLLKVEVEISKDSIF